MDLNDLDDMEICNNCGVLFMPDEEIYLISQCKCKRCKGEL